MMTLPILSQSIKRDSVTILKTTFKSIMKESRKCDSLYVAYDKQAIQLDHLIESNLLMFQEVNTLRIESKEQREEVKKLNKEIIKNAKNEKTGLIYKILIFLAGFTGGILISN